MFSKDNMNMRIEGYMTLEAAMIFPIILFCLLFIIFSGLFFYNRCIVQQECLSGVVRAAENKYESDAKIRSSLQDLQGIRERLAYGSVQAKSDSNLVAVSLSWNGSSLLPYASAADLHAQKFDFGGSFKVFRISNLHILRIRREENTIW